MTDATSPPSRRFGSVAVRGRALAGACAIFGVATPFLNNMPVIDATLAGSALSYGLIACALVLIGFGFSALAARLTTGERLLIALFLAIATLSTLAGLLSGVNPEPASVLKFVMLNLALYLAAKLLQDSAGVDRYLRWYYYLCLFASGQAILATIAGFLGLRQIGLIDLSGGGDRYLLGWWGLLGGDNGNFRTMFYFSEPTYFAQMLLPGIFIAYAGKRWVGAGTLLIGFATTVALSTALAFLVGFAVLILRRGFGPASLAIIAVGTIATAVTIAFAAANPLIYVFFFERGSSVADKLATMQFTISHLTEFPLGIGPVNLPERYGAYVNTANGILNLGALLGFPGLALAAGIGSYLFYVAVAPHRAKMLAAVALGLGSVMLSGVTHGPLLKYFAVFMLSALVLKATLTARAKSQSGEN